MDDERGFIMLHVDINQYSPQLIGSILDFLKSKNNTDVNNSLKNCLSAMKNINSRRQIMWEASRWKHYNDFRVFIMGIQGNNEYLEMESYMRVFLINQFNTEVRLAHKII